MLTEWISRALAPLLALMTVACSQGYGPSGVDQAQGLETRAPDRLRVLFDNAHAQQAANADWVIDDSWPLPSPENPSAETDWNGKYSSWGFALHKSGRYDLETLPPGGRFTFGDATNLQDLSRFQAVVVPEPNSWLSVEEEQALLEFVRTGGGLFMIANHGGSDRNGDGNDSVSVWKKMAKRTGNPFGIQLVGDGVDFSAKGIVVRDPASRLLNGPFGTVSAAAYYKGSTWRIDRNANPTVRPVIYTNRATHPAQDVALAIAEYGAGRVAAWGDSAAAADGTGADGTRLRNGWNDSTVTNAALFLNVTDWLADRRCEDGFLNGEETDVDCGGKCGPCDAGARCLSSVDCSSGTCGGNVCAGPAVHRLDDSCDSPQIAVSPDGTAHIAYSSRQSVMYLRRSGDVWQRQHLGVRSDSMFLRSPMHLALDRHHDVAVAWVATASNASKVMLARRSNGAFTTGSIPELSSVAGLAFDSRNRPVVLGTSVVGELLLTTFDQGKWTAIPVEPGSRAASARFSLGADDGAVVLYESLFGPTTVAHFDGQQWTREQLPEGHRPLGITHEATSGRLHLLVGTSTDLQLGTQSAGAWSWETVNAARAEEGALAWGPQGRLHVLYVSSAQGTLASAPSRFVLAERTAAGWVGRDMGPGSMRGATLAVDGNGLPHLVSCGDYEPYPVRYHDPI